MSSSSSSSKVTREDHLVNASAIALREVIRNNSIDILAWASQKYTSELLLWLHAKHSAETEEYAKNKYRVQIHDTTNVELAHLDGSSPRNNNNNVATVKTTITQSTTGKGKTVKVNALLSASGWKVASTALNTLAADEVVNENDGTWKTTDLPTTKEMTTLGIYMSKQFIGLACEEIDGRKSFIKVAPSAQGPGKLLLELSQGQLDGKDKVHFVRITCKANGDTVFSVTRKGSHAPIGTYTVNTLKVMNEEGDINSTCKDIWLTNYPRRVVVVTVAAVPAIAAVAAVAAIASVPAVAAIASVPAVAAIASVPAVAAVAN